MTKPSGLFALAMAALLLGSSCSRGSQAAGKLMLLRGNFLSARGMYTEAILAYLEALNYDETAPYAEYALGSVYLALDEEAAALQRFAAAEERLAGMPREDHRELIYRINYNRGVVRFHAGNFAAATDQFRAALETDGSRIEAKRNLELSLLSLAGQNSGAAQLPAVSAGEEQEGHKTLFEYIRRKEQEQWKSREWSADADFTGPDY
jgi:Ca-activated chloride channel family protein